MRKILSVSLLFIGSSLLATAQIKKSAVLLGGQISFYTAKNAGNPAPPINTKSTGASLNLSIGKAFKENIVAGIYTWYGQNKNENVYSANSYYNFQTDNYGAGLFYRKYKNFSKNFYFFGELNGGFSGSKQTQENTQPSNKITSTQNGIQLGITPGLSYQIYKKLQLEILVPSVAGLNYAVTKTTSQNITTKGSLFQFSTNLNSSFLNNIALGFKFVL